MNSQDKLLTRKNAPWILSISAAGLISRLPHALNYISASSDTVLSYFPTLGAMRFEECARALVSGSPTGDAFSYASPLYILLIAPFYAAGLSNTAIFLAQTFLGVLTAVVIFLLGLRLGGNRTFSAITAAAWCFYAPAAFYDMTLLPITLLSLVICLWGFSVINAPRGWMLPMAFGLLAGIAIGLRPTYITLFLALISVLLVKRNFQASLLTAAGFVVPVAVLSFWNHSLSGNFSPFVPATGLNLVLGHADGANGYGPPIPEYGLIETPGEDIHQVAARIASENGFFTAEEQNSYWIDLALNWIVSNPEAEMELLLVKTGGVMGHRPFGSYYDLQRDVISDRSLNHLIVPRYLLVILSTAGIIMALVHQRKLWPAAVPVVTSIATSIVFLHSERFWLPSAPIAMALSATGFTLFIRWKRKLWQKSLMLLLIAALSLLPGFLRPAPEIPEGIYLYNRAVKAYNTGGYVLSLSLFESAADAAPEGTNISIQARMEAIRIAQSLGLQQRAFQQNQILQSEIN